MYSQLSAGNKLPHLANFTLATFLNSIGMPKARVLELFKKSPNFNERIASYQLDRIAKQDYSPPGCDKIRSYGLCPSKACPAKHPLSFYRRQARKAAGAKAGEKQGQKEENIAGEEKGAGKAKAAVEEEGAGMQGRKEAEGAGEETGIEMREAKDANGKASGEEKGAGEKKQVEKSRGVKD
jgi:hypothetical protein